jgi:hypothetical protein
MPNRKLHLNRAEQAGYLITLRELQTDGHYFEVPEELLENSRAVDVTVAGGPASLVFESSWGTFYAIEVRLVAERPDTLMDCRIRTDWDDHIVLRSFDEERPVCRLGPWRDRAFSIDLRRRVWSGNQRNCKAIRGPDGETTTRRATGNRLVWSQQKFRIKALCRTRRLARNQATSCRP